MSRCTAADIRPDPWPRRRRDWPERLAEVVAAARVRPFAWGEHDCALFAADCVRAMTGHDPAAPFRGRYSSALGASRAIRRVTGQRGIGSRFGDAILGPRIPGKQAGRGDLVLVPTPTGPAFGVVVTGRVVVVGESGLVDYPTAATLAAWRV